MGSLGRNKQGSGVKYLAEAVILQSLADICDKRHSRECRRFFRGDGFAIWADLAGLSTLDEIRLLAMIREKPLSREYDLEYTLS